MNTAGTTPDVQTPGISTLLEPLDELSVLSQCIQALFERGLTTDNVSLIHDAGKLLEAFTVFGSQHRLFAKMSDEMVNITWRLPYEQTLKLIEMGSVSSDVFHALFQYVSPRMKEFVELLKRAKDVVPNALEAMIRNGLIRQREVNELAKSMYLVPDNRALTILLEYRLQGLRSGITEYFDVPYLVSDYFSEVGLPANLQDAGALGQFLIRELPALTVQAERAEKARKSGQANLFSIEALELFAASGFEKEASRMAAFYLDFNLKDDRHMSRLARLGHGEAMAKKLFQSLSSSAPLVTAELNFNFESPLISTDQSCTLLCIDSSRLSPGSIMEALGHALSVYGTMEKTQQVQLLDKIGDAFERFIQILSPVPRLWRNEVVEGLRNVYYEYEGLDQAGRAMVEEKSIWAMSECLDRLARNPDEQVKLQGQLLRLEHLPRKVWESVDWMKTHTLEADLGL